MTPEQALALTANPIDSDRPDLTILKNSDRAMGEEIIRNPEKYQEAVAASIEAHKEEEPVIETPVEEPEEKKEEVVTNPFASWGFTQEDYDKFVSDGTIRDGKFRGNWGPEDFRTYTLHTLEENKMHGQRNNEVGDLRKENEEIKKQVEAHKTFETTILESDNLKQQIAAADSSAKRFLRNVDLAYDVDIPKASPQDMAYLRGLTMENLMSDMELRRSFKRAGMKMPDSEEGLEELKITNQGLHDKFVEARDRVFQQTATTAYTALAVHESYGEIKKSGYQDAANVYYNNLVKEGKQVSKDDPRVSAVVKEGVAFLEKELKRAIAEDRKPDPVYFTEHPISGHAIPKPDAIEKFVLINKKEPDYTPIEPEQDNSVTVETWAPQAMNALKAELDKYKLSITDDDPLYSRAVNFAHEHRGDPDYWNGDKPRTDLFVRYLKLNEPELITDTLNAARKAALENEYQAKLEEAAAKQTSILSARLERATDTMPSISSSITQSNPGQSAPLVTPEQYKNPSFMVNLAKKQGISLNELFEQQKARIAQLNEADRDLY